MSAQTGRGTALQRVAALAARAGAPSAVTIQVTDRCNYDCVHCYETHGQAPELTLAEVERILGEIADEGVLLLTLTGGEFFMRRDADEILRAARRRQFAVKLLTTGHFVDDARADLIRDLGSIQVDVSVYSHDAAVHDRVTQVPGSHERTLAAAHRLRVRGVPVVLKTPIMSVNAGSIRELTRTARSLGCEHQFDPCVTPREDGFQGPVALRADDAAIRAFYADAETGVWAAVRGRSRADLSAARLRALDQTPCTAGQAQASVNPQGLVFACNSLPIPCGDLRRHSFRQIWRESPQLQHLRQLTWGHIDECKSCDVRAYCSRCHAQALLEDGSVQGPSREACRHAVILRDLLRDRGLVSESDTALPPTMKRRPDGAPRRVRPPALRVVG